MAACTALGGDYLESVVLQEAVVLLGGYDSSFTVRDPDTFTTTINAAAAIGRHEDVGSVEVGKQADLLILDVPDYRHLGYRFGTNLVHTVVKKGIAQDLSR